ncbi:50S ribosomal protein L15 [Candidatus Bathyarchaeota archaeon]|nr:50S ribosomal protein L15 [Candidatus Bathyarchaeota archaeon]
MPHKLRKTRKQRGSRYCGWGQVGQHRKSGSRGGKGKAGGHKHFWIRTVKYEPLRFRSIGFTPISTFAPKLNTINVGDLEELVRNIYGTEKLKDIVELDLTSLGISKILGKGTLEVPLKIRVNSVTSNAEEKIKQAGGLIVE